MKRFPYGHATHPQAGMAVALVLAQLKAQLAQPDHADQPGVGLVYITDHFAPHAAEVLAALSAELPEVTDWVGCAGVGVAANNVEYFDEPALAVMLCDWRPQQYRVFSGVAPLPPSGQSGRAGGFVAHTALVHADGRTPDLEELLSEVGERTQSGQLFGGLVSSRLQSVQFAVAKGGHMPGQGGGTGVFGGGLSGLALGPDVPLVSRVTQGAQPVGSVHTITAVDGHVVLELDGQPALDVLLETRGISLDRPRQAMAVLRQTLVGLGQASPATGAANRYLHGQFGPEVRVRHIVGLDPAKRALAIADQPGVGSQLTFCERNAQAALADLTRICSEVRETIEPESLSERDHLALAHGHQPQWHGAHNRIAGALYVSCAGRGGPHFGSPSAELQAVRRALGDVPLVGFFAGGEIAHQQVYGYSGVLTVFLTEPV